MIRSLIAFSLLLTGMTSFVDRAMAQGVEAGQTVSKRIVLGEKAFPLPPGNWLVAGVAPGQLQAADGFGAFGVIWNVILLRPTEDGQAIDAMVELNINDLPIADGWGVASACARKDFALSVVRYKAGWDSSCFFLTHTMWSSLQTPTPAWAQAQKLAQAKGWRMPTQTVTSGFRVSNRQDIIDARIHFTPAFYNIAEPAIVVWGQSPWHATRLEKDVVRIAFAKALTDWTVMMSGYVEAGIKRRLPADLTIPNPGVDDATLVRDGVVQKRKDALMTLQKAGLISEANFNEQLKILSEKGLDPSGTVIDPATVALYKTLAYRPTVSLANIFIDYYWIGQPFATGVLLLLQVTINSFKFYFHELAWESFGAAGQRRDSPRTLDFKYGGIDS